MKKTRNRLMALYCSFLAIATLLYILGEFLQVDMVLFIDASKQTTFVCSTLMILFTVALLPTALRLFKTIRIKADLVARKEQALAQWGTLRLCIIGLLLVVNTALYFAFAFDTTYGYLAVVVLLCMPFVVPTMSRCQADISPEASAAPESAESADAPEQPDNTLNDNEEANDSHSQL